MTAEEHNNYVAKKPRQSNFELLRIFSILLILVHHFICHGMGMGGAKVTPPDLFVVVDSFAIIGVDLFLLISGYFRIKLSWRSALNLVFICMFCKVTHLCIDTFVLGVPHPVYEWLLKPVFVVSRSGGWFVQVYFMLMFVSPLLNRGLDGLTEKEWRLSLLLLCVISFYLGWLLHNYDDAAGYTLLNFVFVYVIGAAIRRYEAYRRINCKMFVAVACVGVALTFVGSLVVGRIGLGVVFTAYNSPSVLLTACAVFCLFAKLTVQNGWINRVAMSVLTVYLLTDGGNLSHVLYSWAGKLSSTFMPVFCLAVFVCAAVLIILAVACFDGLRQWLFRIIETQVLQKRLKLY